MAILRVVHAARGADLARRGVPRRRGRAPLPRRRARDRARRSAAEVRAETGLTASVGVATTKLLAKLASDLAKPDGLLVVEPGDRARRSSTRCRCAGSGASARRRAARARAARRGHGRRPGRRSRSRRSSPRSATPRGRHLHALARNDDDRAVEPDRGRQVDRPRGDVRRRTAPTATGSSATSLRMADRGRDRGCGAPAKAARTVQLKVRFGDFRTITRSHTLPEPTDLARDIGETARALLDAVDLAARASGCSACRCSSSRTASRCRARSPFDAATAAAGPARARGRASTRCASGSATTRSAPRRSSTRRRMRAGRRGSLWGPDDDRRADPDPVDGPGRSALMRIALIGCGHIGTVHSFALRQLADAGAGRRARHHHLRPRPERGPRRWPRPHGATAADELDAALDDVDVAWICTWTAGAPPGGRGRGRARARRCSARSRSRRRSPTAERIADAAAAGAAPGRARAAPRAGVPRRRRDRRESGATAGRWRWCCATTSTSRSRACTARPGAADVDEGRRRHAHRALDPRPRRAQLDPRPGRACQRHDRVDLRLPGHRRRRHRCGFAYDGGDRATLISVWHQVMTRPSTRRLELLLRGGVPLDRGRLPRARSTSRPRPGRRSCSTGEPPPGSTGFHAPGGAGQVAGRSTPSRPGPSSMPSRGRRTGRPGPSRRRRRPGRARGRRRGLPVGRGRWRPIGSSRAAGAD